MKGALKKLGKLKGRGLDELRVRGAQALAARAERAGLSAHARLPGDAAFFRLFDAARTGGRRPNAEELLAHFRSRAAPRFFASFDDRAATAAEWRRRFGPGAEAALLGRADDVVAGKFDLLGLRGLRFGEGPEPDWLLEPLSGRRAPLVHWSRVNYLDPEVAGDKKVTWELNRHQHFLTLGRAYFLTGEERYAQTFVAHLSSWAEANPPKLGINWASSLEVAFRSVAWLWALHFFRESPHLTPPVFLRALKLLYAHARHLETYLSTYFSPNTHLTGEALGLFYLGTALPELRAAARWRASGAAVLSAELGRQVRPDGVYFEQASYYQRYTADFYTHLLVLARANEAEAGAGVGEKLPALLDHLMFVTRPDGRATLYGDDDGGRLAPLDCRAADDFRAALSTGAALFGREDYKFVAGELAEETFWLLGPEGAEAFDRAGARAPAPASRAFPDGGVYVMRDGWGPSANYMMIDCGPHGALSHGHAHADALAFELAARGRTLLVDPGTFTYTGSAGERDRFRSTAAHNALVLDGESSSTPGGPFSWRTIAAARARAWLSRGRFDYFEGEHDGYGRLPAPATHRRAVLFLKGDYFIVRDTVVGAGEHRCGLHFHFAPGSAPAVGRGGTGPSHVRELWGDAGPGLELFTFGAGKSGGGKGGKGDGGGADGDGWREAEGWASRGYASREAAPVFVYEASIEGEAEFYTFLVSRAAGDAACRARELEARGGRAFELTDGATLDVLLAGDGARTIEAARLSSDFGLAWVRFSAGGGALEEAVLVGGTRLALDGREVVNFGGPVPFAAVRREGGGFVVETEATTAARAGNVAAREAFAART